MPELPEVESARAVIEGAGLHRRIADVDDTDTYVCRPHHPGEIKAALVGRELTQAHRRGKTIWVDTSGGGPELDVHLGMSGRIVITEPTGQETSGGDYVGTPKTRRGRRAGAVLHPRKPEWNRFTITFEDGGELRLFDKRRLGRIRIDADLDRVGPDAQDITLKQFRERVGKGTAPIKARLLNQSVVAGVGNLLADETLWQARISPLRLSRDLSATELTRLRRALQAATTKAIEKGGVHTGRFIRYRRRGAHCPRCGTEVARGTVGGRTTYWCPKEQV